MAMGQASKAYGTQAMAIGVKGEVAVGGYNAIAMGYNSYVGEINETHKSVVTTANPTVNGSSFSSCYRCNYNRCKSY